MELYENSTRGISYFRDQHFNPEDDPIRKYEKSLAHLSTALSLKIYNSIFMKLRSGASNIYKLIRHVMIYTQSANYDNRCNDYREERRNN